MDNSTFYYLLVSETDRRGITVMRGAIEKKTEKLFPGLFVIFEPIEIPKVETLHATSLLVST